MTFPEVDVPLTAPSLLALSAGAIAENPSLLGSSDGCSISTKGGRPCLPLEASTSVFDALRQRWSDVPLPTINSLDVLEDFADGDRLPLDDLNLSHAAITDTLLARLVKTNETRLISLDLTDTQGLAGPEFNDIIEAENVHLDKLKTLALSSYELFGQVPSPMVKSVSMGTLPVKVADDLAAAGLDLETDLIDLQSISDSISIASSDSGARMTERRNNLDRPFTQRCPNVESMTLLGKNYREDFIAPNEFILKALAPLRQLRLLDLSYWQRIEDLRSLRPFSSTLTAVILYDVPDLYQALDTICELTSLRFLDLSQGQRDTGTYPRPVTALHKLVTSLKNLDHLDISSTNLASQPSHYDRPFKGLGNLRSDIFGLRCLEHRLKFLGLFNCDNASHFAEIPADQITGDANEAQIILSLQVYQKRPGLLQIVLNESYQLYRFGSNQKCHREALHLVLSAMRTHLSDSTLQIAGSASLFYIIRQVTMNRVTKRNVVTALLNGMDAHMEEQVMVRNCCLSLCQFEIPQEILFDYNRVARLLVVVLRHHSADHLTQRIVVFLLNSMACHVEGEQKVQVGNIGAIEAILDQIRRKHAASICDDVMEVGWSFLWNITDETPLNCQRFLRSDGLQLFHQCYQSYPGKRKLQRNMMGLMQFQNETELVRNMMGLIGNIAEVQELRFQLMKDDYISIFCALLANLTDGIEISYNSAGVLAHIVSDGVDAWHNAGLTSSRLTVMEKIVEATNSWNLKSRRFINYRSFRPILRLIPMFESPASQHWAVWALANLTSTDGQKYCPYVENEGGVPLLELVATDNKSTSDIKRLAELVLQNIEKWRRKELTADDSMDEAPAEFEDEEQ